MAEKLLKMCLLSPTSRQGQSTWESLPANLQYFHSIRTRICHLLSFVKSQVYLVSTSSYLQNEHHASQRLLFPFLVALCITSHHPSVAAITAVTVYFTQHCDLNIPDGPISASYCLMMPAYLMQSCETPLLTQSHIRCAN